MAPSPLDYQALVARFVTAQLAGDRREALRIVVEDAVGAGARLRDVQSRLIGAAQEEIGRLWQANRITIAQEHLATGISQLVLARLFDHATAAPRNHVVIAVACVPGEQHELPARLVADYLEGAGYTVRYFGADVPTDHLVRTLDAPRPALVALSATMSFHVPALCDAVTQLRAAYPALPILVGGQAVRRAPPLLAELAVHSAPPSPDELIAAVHAITGVA